MLLFSNKVVWSHFYSEIHGKVLGVFKYTGIIGKGNVIKGLVVYNTIIKVKSVAKDLANR